MQANTLKRRSARVSPGNPIEAIQPLRIAMLTIHSSPLGPLGTRNTGGMSVYVRELAKWLGRLGHRVDIFTYQQADAQDPVVMYPNVRLIHLAPKGGVEITKEQLPLQLNAVFEALESYRRNRALTYDLIHSHYWLSGVVGAMAQKRWHCPHVTMFHTLGMAKNSTASGESESDRRIAHEHWLVKAADMIVVAAARERENLIRLYKAEGSRIKIIPCGVNLDHFQPLDRAACRRQLGIPLDRAVALFVGRFAPLKGIDSLLGAVADLKHGLANFHLVVVGGDGPQAASTRSLARLAGALDIQDRVTFTGPVDQEVLPNYYSASDLLAVPSHYESFGLVVLEALACGRPVVATPVGAVETIIRPGINGLIVGRPSRDMVAQGIARVLKEFCDAGFDPGKIRATVADCGWNRVAAAVGETYAELIRIHKNHLSPRRADTHYPFPN